jgi:16S rRNA (adenine1518-N6/adenine1519-N6)-dimethyltransferase
VDDLSGFFRFVEAVFQFRRKQLRAAVARVVGISGDEAAASLLALGIDPARRAETLNLREWEHAFRRLSA